MTGFQEILVIVFIVTAIVLFPRMTARSPKTQRKAANPVLKISGKARAAAAVTAVYLLGTAAYFQPWQKDFLKFVYFGVAPVMLIYLVWWVYAGFKNS